MHPNVALFLLAAWAQSATFSVLQSVAEETKQKASNEHELSV
jgi:hypothetical protein